MPQVFSKRGFVWRGSDGSVRIRVEYTPDPYKEYAIYVQCLDECCTEVDVVTKEENALRVGRFCATLITESVTDLFLMEETPAPVKVVPKVESDEGENEQKPKVEPPVEERVLVAARSVMEKLRKLDGDRRVDTLVLMREAYEWIFSNERSAFRPVEVVTDEWGRQQGVAEACIPFLVAAEAARVDAEWLRSKIRSYLKTAGLTWEMLRRGKLQLPASKIARSEAKVDRWFRHKPVTVLPAAVEPAAVVVVPAPEALAPVIGTATKVDRWFKALRRK